MKNEMTQDRFAAIEHREISDTSSNKKERELQEKSLASRSDGVNSQKSSTPLGVGFISKKGAAYSYHFHLSTQVFKVTQIMLKGAYQEDS